MGCNQNILKVSKELKNYLREACARPYSIVSK